MMTNLLLQEGDVVTLRSATLPKGTFVKLQPHSSDFLDITNPRAVLETTLRSFSCLTGARLLCFTRAALPAAPLLLPHGCAPPCRHNEGGPVLALRAGASLALPPGRPCPLRPGGAGPAYVGSVLLPSKQPDRAPPRGRSGRHHPHQTCNNNHAAAPPTPPTPTPHTHHPSLLRAVGDTIPINYNNKRYFIDIIEAKPGDAISVIETDCNVRRAGGGCRAVPPCQQGRGLRLLCQPGRQTVLRAPRRPHAWAPPVCT